MELSAYPIPNPSLCPTTSIRHIVVITACSLHAHHAIVRGHGLGEEGRRWPAGGGASQASSPHVIQLIPRNRKGLRGS